jgi:hypothetical protein
MTEMKVMKFMVRIITKRRRRERMNILMIMLLNMMISPMNSV